VRLTVLDLLPDRLQLRAPQNSPLLDKTQYAPWQISFKHGACRDFDFDFVLTVLGVEMRWWMIIIVDRDNDAKEAAYLWHVSNSPTVHRHALERTALVAAPAPAEHDDRLNT
jgi:hypothetical protein